MKHLLLTASLACLTASAFGQGQLTLQNRLSGTLVAPIYGSSPTEPFVRRSGNTSTGIPAGTQTYGDRQLLSGTGYTAQLWVGPLGSTMGQLVLADGGSTTVFRTGTGAGFVVQPASSAAVPGVPGGSGSRCAFQLRAWDNAGGTITTWAQALGANGNGPCGLGFSDVVQGTFDLGGGVTLPNPGLPGLTSFSLTALECPEPSLLSLAVPAAGLVIYWHRRRKA